MSIMQSAYCSIATSDGVPLACFVTIFFTTFPFSRLLKMKLFQLKIPSKNLEDLPWKSKFRVKCTVILAVSHFYRELLRRLFVGHKFSRVTDSHTGENLAHWRVVILDGFSVFGRFVAKWEP